MSNTKKKGNTMDGNVQMLFKPNDIAIRSHIELLFSDVPKGYEDGLIEISTLSNSKFFPLFDINSAIDFVIESNTAGKNVYTTPSVLHPNTTSRIEERRKEDLAQGVKKNYRALSSDFYFSNVCWTDIDNLINDDNFKSKYKHAEPNYYVITSRKDDTISTHLYWCLDKPCTNKIKLETSNKGILQALGGDKGTHNATRILKFAGVVAWPAKEGRVKQMTTNGFTKYMPPHDIEELIQKYPIEQTPAPTMQSNPLRTFEGGNHLLSDWSIDDICNMLKHINSDSQYYDWLNVGMALHDYGVPFDIWNAWSSTASNYAGTQEMQSKWNSFTKGRGAGIGTLYYHANQGGYHPSNYKKDIMLPVTQYEEVVNEETGKIEQVESKVKQKKMYYVRGNDMEYIPDDDDFIQGTLSNGTMSVVYGESNCGKTFFMTDLSFHVAEQTKWRDNRVDGGVVLYVALEGIKGLTGRVEAYKREHRDVSLNNFLVMPCPFDFLDATGDVSEFISLLKDVETNVGKVKMIVIDTLARAIGGGDENSGQDMGVLVRHADAIREISGAHICFVHHSGKDRAKGARGHSSLRAAVDTEIEVSRNDGDDYSLVTIAKQRDMEKGDDFIFTLKSVELGTNKHLETKTSCVVEYGKAPDKNKRIVKLSDMQQFVYDSIIHAVLDYGQMRSVIAGHDKIKVVSYDDMREVLESRGYKEVMATKNRTTEQQIKNTTTTIRIALRDKGKIGFNDRFLWINENAE